LTKWGISQAAFPDRDIRNLTKQDAIEIYYKSYWQAASCGSLPYPVALIVFDCAVNQGVGASVKLLQEAVGSIPDGKVGPNTLRCVARKEPREIVVSFMIQRTKRYFGTKGFDRYGRGWMNRVIQVTALAAEWAGKI
jgi:lysozyme family protein